MFNFLSKSISPKWQFQKPGNLWRMLFLESDRLIIEHRSSQEKKASYILLDQQSGAPVWENFVLTHSGGDEAGSPVGEAWWVGMEYVLGNTVYFHSYSDKNNPEHSGIWALDSSSKTVLWERVDLSFICAINNNKFLCYQEKNAGGFAERTFLTVDPYTGQDILNIGFDVSKANRLRDEGKTLEEVQEVQLPQTFQTQSPEFKNIIQSNTLKVNPEFLVAGIDLVEGASHKIYGFHEQTNAMVKNASGLPVKALNYNLEVYDEHNRIYRDVLGKAMSGLIMDGFFMKDGALYYVRERDTLVKVDLARN